MKRASLISMLIILALFLCSCGEDQGIVIIDNDPAAETEAAVSTEPSAATVPPTEPEAKGAGAPADTELVRVKDYIPGIFIEMKYAGTDNFTGSIVYGSQEAFLRYGTVKKLAEAETKLEEQGYALKIWDAFRPRSAQFKLWDIMPDGNYVANPYTGNSKHSNGGAVDICLVLIDGSSVEMPTGFDEFSALADRDYSDATEEAAKNAALLEETLCSYGFEAYFNEWWHFYDNAGYSYDDVERVELSGTSCVPECEEYISLRTAPDYNADVIHRILPDEEMTVIGYAGEFLRVQYKDVQGYVAADYISYIN